MTKLEAVRVLSQFFDVQAMMQHAIENFDFQAGGLLHLGREKVGDPAWFDAAEVWLKDTPFDPDNAETWHNRCYRVKAEAVAEWVTEELPLADRGA